MSKLLTDTFNGMSDNEVRLAYYRLYCAEAFRRLKHIDHPEVQEFLKQYSGAIKEMNRVIMERKI